MKKLSLILLTLVFFLTVLPSMAFTAKGSGKFILVIIDHLSLDDLQRSNLPNFNKMMASGGIGLMNTNTAGQHIPENTYSTVANGVRSLGTSHGPLAFNSDEKVQLKPNLKPIMAGNIYSTLTGKKAAGKVLHLGLPKITLTNEELLSKVNVAILGTTLKSNGIRIGVFGNSDGIEKSRLASLLAIDNAGQVMDGVIDSTILQADKSFPFGFHTNYGKLNKKIVEKFNNLDYIVIETGDTSRLEQYKEFLTPEQYLLLKRKTLERIDNFLGNLTKEVNWNKDQVLIISPTPSIDAATNNNTVTPIIFTGKGIDPGFLSSNSTRRQGIIANTDIAPTILSFWQIEQPPEMVGRPLYSIKSKNTLDYIIRMNRQLVINYNHRPPVLKTFVILQIIYILLAAFIILFSKSPKVLKGFYKLAHLFLIVPVLLLGYRIFRVESLFLTIVHMTFILGLVYWLLDKIKISFYYKIALLSFVTSAGIIVDTLTGSNLVMNSPLGYDPLIGARYYGIGNEFTGVLMGSTIIAFASIFQEIKQQKKWIYTITIIYFVFLIYVLYSPSLGADAGGLITAVISLGFFSLRLAGKTVHKKDMIVLSLLTLALLLLGAFIDLALNQSKGSHIGQAFNLLFQGNWVEIGNIISRKIAMNIKLINYSIWTKVLLASLFALGVLLYKPVGFFKRLESSNPYLKKGFEAVFVASLIGFLVNDSGIVQASTTFIYMIFPLLQLSLMDKLENLR